jgi:hypothetical protein
MDRGLIVNEHLQPVKKINNDINEKKTDRRDKECFPENSADVSVNAV